MSSPNQGASSASSSSSSTASSSHSPPRRSSSLSVLPRGGPLYVMVGVVGFAVVATYYSHYAQRRDKAIMRAGVERDKERLKLLRRQQQPQPDGAS